MAERADVVLVGGGWSALLLGHMLTATAHTVDWIVPWLDPDAAPRPFPPGDDALWRAVQHRMTGGARLDTWTDYGGVLQAPLRRRVVPDAAHQSGMHVSQGRFARVGVKRAQAWSEPAAGWSALYRLLRQRLGDRVRRQAVLDRSLRFQGGWVRRARPVGWSDVDGRRWLICVPAQTWWLCQTPEWRPWLARAGEEDGVAWWCDRDGVAAVFNDATGEKAFPRALHAGVRPHAHANDWLPWGVRGRRGVHVAVVAPPLPVNPSGWLAALLAAGRRVARRPREFGEAFRPPV